MNSLPLVVVYVLGLAMALMQIQRLPRVAAAAGGGFGGLLILLILKPVVDQLIFAMLRSDGQSISVLLTVTGLIFNVLSAIAMGAIAFAIFADRPEVQLPFPGSRPPGAPFPANNPGTRARGNRVRPACRPLNSSCPWNELAPARFSAARIFPATARAKLRRNSHPTNPFRRAALRALDAPTLAV